MAALQFEAIGTDWVIVVEDGEISPETEAQIQQEIHRFDTTYSRFISTSLVSKIAQSLQSTQNISNEMREMLEFGRSLETLTQGSFNLNTAAIQEAYGYDATYSFKNAQATSVTAPPGTWQLSGQTLKTQGFVKFDFGAFGKGFLIDLLAHILLKNGYQSFLIDGGRDFYGTHKSTGQPWTIALEHPHTPDEAIGVVNLYSQGLACSNSHHRKVGTFHHLLDAQTTIPISSVASAYVLADNATLADGISTALFVSKSIHWPQITQSYPCQYLMVTPSLQLQKSTNFEGEMFT